MSIRQSSIQGRASHAPSQSFQSASPAAIAKLIEKKKEYDAVSALERASTLYLQRIEALGEDCEVMAKAGEGTCLDTSLLPSWQSHECHSAWTGP